LSSDSLFLLFKGKQLSLSMLKQPKIKVNLLSQISGKKYGYRSLGQFSQSDPLSKNQTQSQVVEGISRAQPINLWICGADTLKDEIHSHTYPRNCQKYLSLTETEKNPVTKNTY
jgi:hypothetical protein